METKDPVVKCNFPGRTKQKTGMEHDITKIVARYRKTGILDIKEDVNGVFIDTVGIGDFHECMNKIAVANQRFEMLPSKIRNRFSNDPGQMMDYLKNLSIDNVEEAVQLGLITKKESEKLASQKHTKGGDTNDDKSNN